MARQKAKRATKRWLEGAPDYVLAVFDSGDKFADRYTIVFGGKMQEHTCGQDWLHALSIGEGGVGGSFEFKTWEFGQYRVAHSREKIRWRDLPLGFRLRARYWAETDHMALHSLTHATILKIGAEENGLEQRLAG